MNKAGPGKQAGPGKRADTAKKVKTGRTQSERKAESERKLISAARRLFARQGYMRTTVNQVGVEAGYTGPLVSARFGSKEALLRAVVKHLSGRFRKDQVEPVTSNTTASEALQNYIALYLSEVTQHESHIRALYAIMGEAVSSVPEIRPDIAHLTRGMRRGLAGIVQRGVDSGEFRANVDPALAATMIISVLRGTVMQALLDPREVKVKELIPLVQRQIMLSLQQT